MDYFRPYIWDPIQAITGNKKKHRIYPETAEVLEGELRAGVVSIREGVAGAVQTVIDGILNPRVKCHTLVPRGVEGNFVEVSGVFVLNQFLVLDLVPVTSENSLQNGVLLLQTCRNKVFKTTSRTGSEFD